MGPKTKLVVQLFIVALFLAAGVFGLRTLTASKAPLKKVRRPIVLPIVRAIAVRKAQKRVPILGQGTVRPLREIRLIPQVGGKVVYTSPALVDGGAFKKGTLLLQIEAVDYQLAVSLYKSRVKDSESKLQLLQEEAAVAREEWIEINAGKSGSENSPTNPKPPPLLVKEPQLAAANAKLEADRAELQKTEIQLKRTKLKAPFSGRVSSKSVDIGQFVSPGQPLATLYSTEAAEIKVPLESADLYWFHVPGFTPGKGPGARAVIEAHVAGRALTWKGRVVRSEGKLDERTRMINVIVRVEKPYAKKPPLAVGLFVAVTIEGRMLANATLIPRSALQAGNVVWVIDDNRRLRFRKVQIAKFIDEGALIRRGLSVGEIVVISPVKAVADGMAVRVALAGDSEGS